MVDGVNQGPTGQMNLKLKGKDAQGNKIEGKSIELSDESLKGLRKTKGNESLFTKYDSNNDGVIDEKEALVIRNNLQTIAGNGKLSQREIDNTFGDGTFQSLLSLQAQQEKLKSGGVYQEGTRDQVSIDFQDGKSELTTRHNFSDGSYQLDTPDGVKTEYTKDGAKTKTVNPDGSQIIYGEGERVTKCIKPDQSTVEFPDENTSISRNADGHLTQTIQVIGNKDVTKIFDGTGNETPTSVTAEYREGQPPVTVKASYDPQDTELARPLQEIRNAGLPTQTTTDYTYEDNGNVRAVTKNSAGEVISETYKDKDGNDVVTIPPQPEVAGQYTVRRNDTIRNVVIAQLRAQGIEVNEDNINQATTQLLEMNKVNEGRDSNGYLKIAQNHRFNGQPYLIAGAKLEIPKFNIALLAQDEAATPATQD